ncbi:MAG TPA: hypothetical protein VKS60_07700 [Stellaceae bacterium]|nr:hypothetical protein [Stellaceae bacterium]
MTSEVALLNRSAVALAADSAATVQHWEKDHFEKYYFKGTNKIFQLSTAHPVGIMIYATASLQGTPWDLLIKCYRDQLGVKSHDYVEGYALDLFDYITKNSNIFSNDIQEKQFLADVDIVASRILSGLFGDNSFQSALDDVAKQAVATNYLSSIETKITSSRFVANTNQNDLDSALAKYENSVKEFFGNSQFYSFWAASVDLQKLARLSIEGQFKADFTALNNSGIVVAGFGDKEYFPRLNAYRCYGLILGKLIFEEETAKRQTISQTDVSAFVSFAQDDMIQTFSWGASLTVLMELDRQTSKSLDIYYDELVTAGLARDLSNDTPSLSQREKIKRDTLKRFRDGVIEYSLSSHSQPMRRVLGALPFDELAELAHTLVLLESLKERVTSASSSVSGPIDVAVISKNDGFIWIKRKHYFDPKLNPRYFLRRGLIGLAS